jgi:hypothetical protein
VEETFSPAEAHSDLGDGVVHDSLPAVQRRPQPEQDSRTTQRLTGGAPAGVTLQEGNAAAAPQEGRGRSTGPAAADQQRRRDGASRSSCPPTSPVSRSPPGGVLHFIRGYTQIMVL